MSYQTSENSASMDTGPLRFDPGVRPHRYHIGRSWTGNQLEIRCLCRKAPCGLVDTAGIHPDCPEHAFAAEKTMRQIHHHYDCSREP